MKKCENIKTPGGKHRPDSDAREQIFTANLAMLFPIRIASVRTVTMENNASVKEANTEITVAKTIITNLAAISKSKLLWNCEIHFEIYRHRLHTVTAQPPSEQTNRSTNMKWEVPYKCWKFNHIHNK